jgi:hypothetical protein
MGAVADDGAAPATYWHVLRLASQVNFNSNGITKFPRSQNPVLVV